jgi:hypothetical protein
MRALLSPRDFVLSSLLVNGKKLRACIAGQNLNTLTAFRPLLKTQNLTLLLAIVIANVY